MTVKELIEQLQTLDQDTQIWVLYDEAYAFEPEFRELVNAEVADEFEEDGLKEGDYVMLVG